MGSTRSYESNFFYFFLVKSKEKSKYTFTDKNLIHKNVITGLNMLRKGTCENLIDFFYKNM